MASEDVENALHGHLDAGRLHLWAPSRPLPAQVGRLYLTDGPLSRINSSWHQPGDDRELLRERTRAVFDQFTELGRVLIHLFDEAFGRTGVAQLKITRPRPGVRLFGALLDHDTYVGTKLMLRDELSFKVTGQAGQITYQALGEALETEWDQGLVGLSRRQLKELRKEL